jgi:hypothetical protein
MSLTTKVITAASAASVPATINSTDAAALASGRISFTANPNDGENFVLNDGVNPAVTFQFYASLATKPTETATLRGVLIGLTREYTAGYAATAVNDVHIVLNITASIGNPNQVLFAADTYGAIQNQAITTTSASITPTGMANGANGQSGQITLGNFAGGVLHCQRVKDKSGLVQVGAATGLTASVAIQGRPTPTAPWFTIVTLTQTDWNADGNFQAAKVITLFPELRAVVTITAGTGIPIDVWITE